MAKVTESIVGIDLGHHALKSVLLQRRSDKAFQLSRYAMRKIEGPLETPAQIAHEVTLLLNEMGGGAKACVVALTSPDSVLRIVEQPLTPREILRDALRINGASLLNHDVRDFVLDCAAIQPAGDKAGTQVAAPGVLPKVNYLVGGLSRREVARLDEAFQASHGSLGGIQLAPVCIFSAFEFSNEEVFKNDAFVLLDIGHASSTVIVGFRKEVILARTFDYGGKALADSLTSHGGGKDSRMSDLPEEPDPLMMETARHSLVPLIREISRSIAYFEGSHEEKISRIFASGGTANSKAILQLLASELGISCETWNPFAKCKVALPQGQEAAFANDMPHLNVACGAAAAFLKNRIGQAPLYLDLHHEIKTRKHRRKRDPFKIGIMALAVLAAAFVAYYFWNVRSVAEARSEAMRLQDEWSSLEPKEKAAIARKEELDEDDQLAGTLVHEVENRFYWGPLLDEILRIVPPEIQITGFEGTMENHGTKKIILAISGISAGSQPRAVAESLRIAVQKSLSLHYQQATSVFRSLDDGTQSIQYQGRTLQTAKFVIDLTFVSPDIDEETTAKTSKPPGK